MGIELKTKEGKEIFEGRISQVRLFDKITQKYDGDYTAISFQSLKCYGNLIGLVKLRGSKYLNLEVGEIIQYILTYDCDDYDPKKEKKLKKFLLEIPEGKIIKIINQIGVK